MSSSVRIISPNISQLNWNKKIMFQTTNQYIYIYICMYISMYVYIYICMYNIYMYVCIYIYTYAKDVNPSWSHPFWMSPGYLWKRCPATARDAEIDLAPEAPYASSGNIWGPQSISKWQNKNGKEWTCYMFLYVFMWRSYVLIHGEELRLNREKSWCAMTFGILCLPHGIHTSALPAPWYTYPPLFSSKDTANVVQSRPRKVADVKMDIGLPKNGGYS